MWPAGGGRAAPLCPRAVGVSSSLGRGLSLVHFLLGCLFLTDLREFFLYIEYVYLWQIFFYILVCLPVHSLTTALIQRRCNFNVSPLIILVHGVHEDVILEELCCLISHLGL